MAGRTDNLDLAELTVALPNDEHPPSYSEVHPNRHTDDTQARRPGIQVGPQLPRGPVRVQPQHAQPRPVITAQPRRVMFDETSMSVLQRMQRCNQFAAQHLNGLVGNIAANMEVRAAQDISSMPNDLDYGYMLSSLLLPGEQVVTLDGAQLQHIEALTRNDEGTVQSKLPRGRTVLTNKRLLILSSSSNQETSLTPSGRNAGYSYYSLSSTSTNSVIFVPIPIESIKCVMMSSEVSSKWTSAIKGVLGCCALCGQSDDVSQWKYDQPTNLVRNVRLVRLGVILPPFDKPMVVDIRLESFFPLRIAAEFVAKIQAVIGQTN